MFEIRVTGMFRYSQNKKADPLGIGFLLLLADRLGCSREVYRAADRLCNRPRRANHNRFLTGAASGLSFNEQGLQLS
jgi:hypothetical protein